jgi:hypothetical protein
MNPLRFCARIPSFARAALVRSVTLPTALTRVHIPQILKLHEHREFSGLLYYSPHSVAYHDELYPTALHLFEARKFLDHRPDLAEHIRLCERVEEVILVILLA